VNWKNEGTVTARDNVTHLSVDDVYRAWFSLGYQPVGYESRHANVGTDTVKGGRHTLCQNTMDWDDRVWEYDEGDNTYCRQFVWSPYALYDETPVSRSRAPKKDSLGYNYYNNDGFSFYVKAAYPNKYWSAVGVLPSSTSADYDLRLWNIGDYTGSQNGFGGGYLQWSSYLGNQSEFVIVNDNTAAAGTYYAGAMNWNDTSGDFRIEEDTSTKIYEGSNGPYSKADINVLDIFECYLWAGDYGFKLEQVSGTCDLGMSLYDDETVTAKKSGYMTGGYANSTGDGGDEYMQVTIPDGGFHGLVVWKVDASDFAKQHSYRIKMGQCATPGALANPSPADGATNVSVNTDLDWSDCTNTEYYQVWLKEGSGSWVEQGKTENSDWTLPTLNEGTHYEWYIVAWNICGSWVNVYWEFTTEDNTPPTPNPMTWATRPHAVSSSQISMTATTASDATSPINYYFQFTGSPTGGTGGTTSGWISPVLYSDSGLSPNRQYGYRVMARDGYSNMTAYSGIGYSYTLANIPGATGFSNVTQTSIQANWTANGNRAGTQYYCQNTTAGTNSGWTTNTSWNSTGLSPGTTYAFRVKARNGNGVETGWRSLGSQQTQTGGVSVNITPALLLLLLDG